METVYVSENGNNQWDGAFPDHRGGTKGPLSSLTTALAQVRARRAKTRNAPYCIELASGDYAVEESIRLDARDSGTLEHPLFIRTHPRNPAMLRGGLRLKGFRPVTERDAPPRLSRRIIDRVLVTDLNDQGIQDYGRYRARGFYCNGNAAMELFCQDKPMIVARYPKGSPLPNHGYLSISSVDDHNTMHYRDPETQHWRPAEDIYANGYWSQNWATRICRVTAFDPVIGTFQAAQDAKADFMTPKKGGRFFFFNVLEALSDPGEYYIDRENGKLYFIPPFPGAEDHCIVSICEAPLIRIDQAEHVRFEHLILEAGRSDGFHITGGQDIQIAGCCIRNMGRDAIVLHGGTDHAVLSSDIYQIGMSGVSITGGDPSTGSHCRHRIHNCHIHHIAREGKTYFGAINMEFCETLNPCGVEITHNRLHDHPHSLLFFWGNDHHIAFNEFYNFTLEGDDCGCCYSGRDFSFQGNRIEYNYFHHAGDCGNEAWGSSGVYLDDGAGGTRICNNLFLLVNRAVQAGGGVNTVIQHNAFMHGSPAVWFDERCAAARADRGDPLVHGMMQERFTRAGGKTPGFIKRYPNMDKVKTALEEGTGILAWGADISHNTILGSKPWFSNAWGELPAYVKFENNRVAEPPPLSSSTNINDLQRHLSSLNRDIDVPETPGLMRDRYRPELEDVWTEIEIIKSPATDGTAGKARLRLTNSGDVPVQGEEWIEIKCRRHGPGTDAITVPYAINPGTQQAIEFEVPLPSDYRAGVFELWLCSRGERIRPAWCCLDIACGIRADWQLRKAPTRGSRSEPGTAELTLHTIDPALAGDQVVVSAKPHDVATVEHKALIPSPRAGECRQATINVTPSEDAAPRPRIRLTVDGLGVRPAILDMPLEYAVQFLAGFDEPEALFTVLAKGPWLPVQHTVKVGSHEGNPDRVASVVLALSGNDVALLANVRDPNPQVTDLLWDGSCIEVFAAPPDQQRLQAVFGCIEVGHLFLAPPAREGATAKAWRFKGNQYHPAPDVNMAFKKATTGYQMAALIPFPQLALPEGSTRILAEVQVSICPQTGNPARRATLFGSRLAYQDTCDYGLMSTQ